MGECYQRWKNKDLRLASQESNLQSDSSTIDEKIRIWMWPPMAIIELVRVLSPVGRPKVVATTAKIPMLVAGTQPRLMWSNFVSPARRPWRFLYFLQRQRLLKFACIHLHLSVFAIFCQACSWCVWKQNRPWRGSWGRDGLRRRI